MTTEPRSNRAFALTFVRNVLTSQAEAILSVAGQLTGSVADALELVSRQRGRVIFTGVGKMGCIARKAAATFCSTGTPAIFLHAAEAAHGDMGVVTDQDVVVALSNSGRTEEVLNLLPYLDRLEIPTVCITGDPGSPLASRSQVVIDIRIAGESECEPPAPTSSTTVALAICDGLALALAHQRGFTREQFALFHPGGSLGRKLLMKISGLMRTGEEIPRVTPEVLLRDAIIETSAKRMGCVLIVNGQNRLEGILTDGDIRRIFERYENPLEHGVSTYMTRDCVGVDEHLLAADSLQIMERHAITVLPVVDANNTVKGIVHLHMLVQAGLA